MSKPDAHEISVKTRTSIRTVARKYGLDDDQLRKTGLIDRIIKGYLHLSKNNIRLGWNYGMPSPGDKEYHIVCEVVSGRDIPKTIPESKSKWNRPYQVGARFEGDGDGNFYLEDVGGRYEFRMGRRSNSVTAHSCEDILFQQGIKDIPTACYHMDTVWCFLPSKLNDACEEGDVKFHGELDVTESMVDLYNELQKHDLKSWQRLNVLYAHVFGELNMWRTGNAFLPSVAKYLDRKSLQWEQKVS